MRRIAGTVLFFALVAGIVLYAGGVFGGDRIEPGRAEAPAGRPAPPASAVAARVIVDVVEEAVGTVESRTQIDVAAQVTGRVVDVRAEAGGAVVAGDVLVVLDDRELAARLDQARQGLVAARAARERARQAKASGEALLAQTKARFERIRTLLEGNAATPQQMEDAEAGYLQAKAGVAEAEAAIATADADVQRAERVVDEAQVAFGHARIPAPIDGVVAERVVEPGDLAWPGRVLVEVLDPRALRLEAQVREGLIARVRRDQRLLVTIPAVDRTLEGTVAEVLPAADPRTRTFRVRVDLPFLEGVFPGMFGRLHVPAGRREAVSVPRAAVVTIGQLETVLARGPDGRWGRRLVTTGAALSGGAVEVLSGVAGGETVGLPAPGEPR